MTFEGKPMNDQKSEEKKNPYLPGAASLLQELDSNILVFVLYSGPRFVQC